MPIVMSVSYIFSALALLALCSYAYLKVTPYPELKLIREGNVAAAMSFGGALLGLSLPIGSAIFFTKDLIEMLSWGMVGCGIQMLLFVLIKRQIMTIEDGNVAAGVFSAFVSIATGLIVALSIS